MIIPSRNPRRSRPARSPAPSTLLGAALAAAFGLGANAALAGAFTLGGIAAGNYEGDGTRFGGTYATDGGVFAADNRGYVVFDTSLLRGRNVNSTTLQVNSGSVANSYSNPIIGFYNVSTPASTVMSGGGAAVFSDLGGGTLYGTQTISTDGANYSLSLGSAGATDVRTSSNGDGRFTVGMALQNTGTVYAEAFGGSNAASSFLSVSTVDPVWSATGASFGNVLVGSTRSGTNTISNLGVTGTFLAGTLNAVSAGGITATGTSAGALDVTTAQGFSASFAPTQRGAVTVNQSAVVNTGASGNEIKFISMTGTGVAPVTLETRSASSGPVVARVGTSVAAGTATVRNVGDGNLSGAGTVSNLRGTVGVSGVAGSNFSGSSGSFSLADGASTTFSATYNATSRGVQTGQMAIDYANGSSDGRNLASSSSIAFQGLGVGPVFAADALSIAFADIEAGDEAFAGTRVGNVTTDPYGVGLTGMTLRGAGFGGAWGHLFSLDAFSPGVILGAGDWFDLDFVFSPTAGLAAGLYEADFTLFTDVGAALGGAGQSYSIHLAGTVTEAAAHLPEPATHALLLGALGLLGMVRRHPRRR